MSDLTLEDIDRITAQSVAKSLAEAGTLTDPGQFAVLQSIPGYSQMTPAQALNLAQATEIVEKQKLPPVHSLRGNVPIRKRGLYETTLDTTRTGRIKAYKVRDIETGATATATALGLGRRGYAVVYRKPSGNVLGEVSETVAPTMHMGRATPARPSSEPTRTALPPKVTKQPEGFVGSRFDIDFTKMPQYTVSPKVFPKHDETITRTMPKLKALEPNEKLQVWESPLKEREEGGLYLGVGLPTSQQMTKFYESGMGTEELLARAEIAEQEAKYSPKGYFHRVGAAGTAVGAGIGLGVLSAIEHPAETGITLATFAVSPAAGVALVGATSGWEIAKGLVKEPFTTTGELVGGAAVGVGTFKGAGWVSKTRKAVVLERPSAFGTEAFKPEVVRISYETYAPTESGKLVKTGMRTSVYGGELVPKFDGITGEQLGFERQLKLKEGERSLLDWTEERIKAHGDEVLRKSTGDMLPPEQVTWSSEWENIIRGTPKRLFTESGKVVERPAQMTEPGTQLWFPEIRLPPSETVDTFEFADRTPFVDTKLKYGHPDIFGGVSTTTELLKGTRSDMWEETGFGRSLLREQFRRSRFDEAAERRFEPSRKGISKGFTYELPSDVIIIPPVTGERDLFREQERVFEGVSVKPIIRPENILRPKQKTHVDTGLGTPVISDIIQAQDIIPSTDVTQKQKQKAIVTPIFDFPTPPEPDITPDEIIGGGEPPPPPPPTTTRIIIPPSEDFELKRRKKKKGAKSRLFGVKTFYTPSVEAAFKGIYGSPKGVTVPSLQFRPMLR